MVVHSLSLLLPLVLFLPLLSSSPSSPSSSSLPIAAIFWHVLIAKTRRPARLLEPADWQASICSISAGSLLTEKPLSPLLPPSRFPALSLSPRPGVYKRKAEAKKEGEWKSGGVSDWNVWFQFSQSDGWIKEKVRRKEREKEWASKEEGLNLCVRDVKKEIQRDTGGGLVFFNPRWDFPFILLSTFTLFLDMWHVWPLQATWPFLKEAAFFSRRHDSTCCRHCS